ncbi:MAG: hypothetical protein HYW08_12335 [candidate division NC10 bacterium]|nr:hypothetical protein [Candidatus Rokubacteria bacterium]MBI2563151.1 hypothetical protein [candidate division NC10 bacterium]
MRKLVLAVMLLAPATAWTQAPTLDGTWTGTWRTGSGQSGSLVFRLTQAGEAVSGTYDAEGGPAGSLRGVRVRGTLKGERLELTTRDAKRAFEGRLQGDTISGTYWGTRSVKSFYATKAKAR